jgi:hypothetical protein
MYGLVVSLAAILAMSPGSMSTERARFQKKNVKTKTTEGDIRFAASKRSPSTPREMRSFVYAASFSRTYSVPVAKLARNISSEKLGRGGRRESKAKKNRLINLISYVLSESTKLAGPDFLCIAVVDDIVVGFEAAVMEIRIVVNTGIIVIGKA